MINIKKSENCSGLWPMYMYTAVSKGKRVSNEVPIIDYFEL